MAPIGFFQQYKILLPLYFSILNWNLLSDQWLAQTDFTALPSECTTWDYRKNVMETILAGASPEIMVLTEVDHYEEMREWLSQVGYESHWCPRHSPTERPEPEDGVAVFWRHTSFQMVDALCLEYRPTPQPHRSTEVANLVKLAFRGWNYHLMVAGTYLKPGTKTPHEELRVYQMTQLLEEIKILLGESEGVVPVVVAGDFNSGPESETYRRIQHWPGPHFKSAYGRSDFDGEPAYTSCSIQNQIMVSETTDYIWYTHRKLTMIGRLALPDLNQIGNARLPSCRYPSDHLHQMATFRIEPDKDL